MVEQGSMLAVGIEGSPRRTGNSTSLLKTFFDRLRFMTFEPNKLDGPRRGISNLGPRDAWKSRPELIETLRNTGIEQAKELMALC